MTMSLKASFVSYLNQKYNNLEPDLLNQLISEQLLSPFQISLSPEQLQTIKKEISGYWKLRNWGEINLIAQFSKYELRKPANYSVCMSYDFHINPQGLPELIEINTNSSFLALGLELYSFLKLPNPVGSFNETDLIKMFLNELELCAAKEKTIAIVDENPQQQKLYLEFLLYKTMMNNNGISAEIFNIDKTNEFKKYALIYNRYTDFYLQEKKSSEIKNLYNSGSLNLSPQPFEYFLLADKQRFIDWNRQTDVEKPLSLLKTYDLAMEDKDKIWSERKHLFFKPKNSFGGKQAYKGASMSRKILDEVCNPNFIAQQLSAAPVVEVEMDGQKQEFKYDLRCYVYKDQLQLIVARLYQGQTTNLKTQGGGFACVTIR